MLIFDEGTPHALYSGIKTEARQISKIGEAFDGNRVFLEASSRTKWKIGSKYNFSLRSGTPAVGMVVITSISEEYVCDISPKSLRAEGFYAEEIFWLDWQRRFGAGNSRSKAWVLRIQPVLRVGQSALLGAEIETQGHVLRPGAKGRMVWSDEDNCLHFAPDIKGMRPFFVRPHWLV